MAKKEAKTTKQHLLREIEAILRKDLELDAELIFSRIEKSLEPDDNKAESPASGGIGYVHIDEKLQAEYLAWEKGIKQEWLATIENIRESIRKERNNPLA